MTLSPYIGDFTEEQLRYLKSAGFPTFDEFRKNPDKYKDTWDSFADYLEKGPNTLRNHTKGRHVYHVKGFRTDKPEKAIQMCMEAGWKPDSVEEKIDLESVGNGQFIHHVYITPKKEFQQGGQGS